MPVVFLFILLNMLGTNFIIPFWKIPTDRYCAALPKRTVLSSKRQEHQPVHLPGRQVARDTLMKEQRACPCLLSAHS